MTVKRGRTSAADHTPAVRAGSPAPEIELDSHLGTKFRLSDLREKQNAVVVFYPFAFTGV
ncbi:MAG: redoxin domain-containing protein [Candidatus Baltobacteraceae bacterium]